jgi:eukaryotic-like serine/threonine-protein kinase
MGRDHCLVTACGGDAVKDDDELGLHETLIADSEAIEAAAARSAVPAPLIGGRYEILSLAGSGAMGSVYRARDVELDEIVALKFLREELLGSAVMIERFRREVKMARRVTHKHVARMFDIGDHGKDKYLTMEFIEGEPLSGLLARSGPLPIGRVIALIEPICQGLEAAHAVGVVHRDLKPDNVMITNAGRIVITDFGIARGIYCGDEGMTMGMVVGTPAYMAPEQVEGASDVDQRADIYALGVMLFEMLTGELPFSGGSAITVAAARLTQPVPDPRNLRPELDARVANVVERCLARHAEERFSSAGEVLAALAPLATAVATAPTLEGGVAAARPPAVTTTASGDRTVAVLPFKNLGAPEDAYLADGITDDLVDTLSMAQGLRVRPRSATARFASVELAPADLGRELDVQVLVEGSVRRRGETLRVSARVVSVAEGFQLWAHRFDRPAGDALVISDDVANAVARALTLKPALQPREAPTDPVAIDLYLRGRAELRAMDKPSLQRAAELLEQAHRRAPDDATILAAYARAQTRLGFLDYTLDAREVAKQALVLTERAVAAAPERGEALLALAQVRFALGDYVPAAELATRAIARAPLLADAHELWARIALEVGPIRDGIVAMERAQSLDPLVDAPALELGRAYALLGDFARARALFLERPSAVGARAALVARLMLWSGEPPVWEPLLPADGAIAPGAPGTLVIAVRQVLGDGSFDPELDAGTFALASSPERPLRFRTLLHQVSAELLAFAGQTERALERLEAAFEVGLIDWEWLERCQALERLRGSPRFAPLRQQLEARVQPIRAALTSG